MAHAVGQLVRPRAPAAARRPDKTSRRATVLYVVVVVLALISLAGYRFLITMQAENQMTRIAADRQQLDQVAGSARDLVGVLMEMPRSRRAQLFEQHGDHLLSQLMVDPEDDQHPVGAFAVLRPSTPREPGAFVGRSSALGDGGGHGDGWVLGWENESAKLHLATALHWEAEEPGAGRAALMQLPGMAESVADAILDWIDPDDAPREQGAESDYYLSQERPYRPRQGVPNSLDELLLVRGVTREDLFGIQARIPVGQQQDPTRPTTVNREVAPWDRYLTVRSRMRNESFDGQPRIWLNDPDLIRLHQRLVDEFPVGWANFVVLYRQYGVRSSDSSDDGPTRDPSNQTVDLNVPASHQVESLVDLVAAVVPFPESSSRVVSIESPWRDSPDALRVEFLPFADRISTEGESVLEGRIDVNSAPAWLLQSIPGVDAGVAEQIVAARAVRNHEPQRHPVWLLADGIVDHSTMRRLLRYLGSGGDVVRCTVLAGDPDGRRAAAVELLIDGSRRPFQAWQTRRWWPTYELPHWPDLLPLPHAANGGV